MLNPSDSQSTAVLDSEPSSGSEGPPAIEKGGASSDIGDPPVQTLSDRVLSIIKHLPVVRCIYFQVSKAVNDPRASLERVAALVASDAILTGRILKMANSAAFASKQRLVNAKEAVLFLGGDQVKNMILAVEVFSFFSRLRVQGFSPEKQWRHSMAVANAAKGILRSSGASRTDQDSAYTAGLLHDIGKLLLASNVPARYETALAKAIADNPESVLAAEAEEFQVSHPEVGGIILESWKLPSSIVNAVLLHHDPVVLGDKNLTVEAGVAIANSLVREASSGLTQSHQMALGIREIYGEEQITIWKSNFLSKD